MSYDQYQYTQAQYPYNQAGQYYTDQYGNLQYSPYPPARQPIYSGWFDFKNSSYIKGLLIAAGVTLLVTNPKVQQTVLKGMAKAWSGMQYGVEEIKEQINDIKAEMQYKQEQKTAADEAEDA